MVVLGWRRMQGEEEVHALETVDVKDAVARELLGFELALN